ncbi:hypothetical protein ColLi_12143 [Colletotrichum liriopes]|uniref:Uncharacterized protein n=1 Tax=Colletotrichum liriopes TaxID=708192 RepID=A0AA37LXN3_9PEZI|nr:hypothetical protein ColLi_12143 [Colletotrichum liriopes]
MKPEHQLSELVRTFPGPDADTVAFERIIRRRQVDVPEKLRLCLTGYEMNHPGLTESKVRHTLQYYGIDTLDAQYLAQDVLHCRKNYDYCKILAEKEGTVWPLGDVMQIAKAEREAEPVASMSIVIMMSISIVLVLVVLFCLFSKADAWLHSRL